MPKGTATLIVGEYNGIPKFSINGNFIPLTGGENTVDFHYEYGKNLVFEMSGKERNDTMVVDNEVIADKYIILDSLSLDYIVIENWQLHTHIWDNFFSTNEQKTLSVPDKDNFPLWCMKLSGTTET